MLVKLQLTKLDFSKEQKKPKRFNTSQRKVLTRSKKQDKVWIDKNLLF